jgi:transcription elongation factor GreA
MLQKLTDFGKKYEITKKTKDKLEKELEELQTKGREDIATKLDWLRQQPSSEEENPFSDILEDKNYLEKRISELKLILKNSKVVDENKKYVEVAIGSRVTVGFEGFEEEYHIVSSIEADPMNKKISDESPVGSALLGYKVGDNVQINIGALVKTYRILKIK